MPLRRRDPARSIPLLFAAVVAIAAGLLAACDDGGSGAGDVASGAAAAGGANRFALDCYAALDDADANLFFSPYSLNTALRLLEAGARGATAEEIRRALGMPYGDGADATWHTLLRGADTTGVELRVANAVWVDESQPLRAAYLDLVDREFGEGSVRTVDFSDGMTAPRRINEWAAEVTNGRIRDLFHGPIAGPAILANAIWFRGKWAEPFPAEDTVPAKFTRADGTTARVFLMSLLAEGGARYGAFERDGSWFVTPFDLPSDPELAAEVPCYPDADGFAIVELPYKGERLSMVVFAPNRPDGLADLQRALMERGLPHFVDRLERRAVNVYVPRFRMETEYHLVETLRALGVTTVFGEHADLSGMSDDPRLLARGVVQKAFVETGEEGTEAAAVTTVAVGVEQESIRDAAPFVPTFLADRPFLFLIRDRASGLVLFLGRYGDPEGATDAP